MTSPNYEGISFCNRPSPNKVSWSFRPAFLQLTNTYIQYTLTAQCTEGQLRLVETPSIGINEHFNANNAGRLEVCLNGQWGTIAADSFTTPWSEKNAQVACRQLGFSGVLNSVFQNTYVENFL